MKIEPKHNAKQEDALRLLLDFDNGITEVLYGGAAGGGKSWVGCEWLIVMCLQFRGIRMLMARLTMKDLKLTTFNTFIQVAKSFGLEEGKHWKFNGTYNIVTFFNGSEIILRGLFQYPSDPEFNSLGSLEITGAFIDETNQVVSKAKEVVKTRIRYKLEDFCGCCGSENTKNRVIRVDEDGKPNLWRCLNKQCNAITAGIIPKLFMSCNPAKNWVFIDFYNPWKKGSLAEYRAFVQALPNDNKQFLSAHYIKLLNQLSDRVSKMRLLHGIWEYSGELSMFDYTQIQAGLTRRGKFNRKDRHFMSVDVARLGKDKSVIVVMNEHKVVVKVFEIGKCRIPDLVRRMKQIQKQFDIDDYDIVIDSDGVGGGVADAFDVSEHIVNNQTALNGENYYNLKTQLYFKLSEFFNDEQISFHPLALTDDQGERITEELQILQREKTEMDGKICMTSKSTVKKMIKRSPDYSDALAYMMYFFLEGEQGDSWL